MWAHSVREINIHLREKKLARRSPPRICFVPARNIHFIGPSSYITAGNLNVLDDNNLREVDDAWGQERTEALIEAGEVGRRIWWTIAGRFRRWLWKTRVLVEFRSVAEGSDLKRRTNWLQKVVGNFLERAVGGRDFKAGLQMRPNRTKGKLAWGQFMAVRPRRCVVRSSKCVLVLCTFISLSF